MTHDLQKEVERLTAEVERKHKALVDIYNRLPIVRTTEPIVVSGLLYDIGEMAFRGMCPAQARESCSCEPESSHPCNQCVARGLKALAKEGCGHITLHWEHLLGGGFRQWCSTCNWHGPITPQA